MTFILAGHIAFAIFLMLRREVVVCLLEPRPVRRPEMFFDNLGNFNEGRSVAAQCHDKSNVLYWIRVTSLKSIC